ncbi:MULTISPECIES: NADH-quinone oxidoreductase subunit B family protein [unclassified Lebetimonas]|uniref:NADH-quinone oxidoreductase subunit B family protein n=1 Tax=unclassified Lebetimonas TaxID=2648158 RepID=UPI000467192A|nr:MULTISPECIES: NADH-quinone oxidoreductase subunit B family protein [unclassified Lebetimonas]
MSKKPTVILPNEIFEANKLEDKIKHLQNIKRSFNVFRIDCGSCNGCEIEIFAAITPMWDPERFGFKLVASPRHADILVCTGPLTRQTYYPLLRAYEATPDPKVVVAVGACGCSGGIFYDSYAVWGGIKSTVPVDVFVPGCPPHPASIIYGLAVGLDILKQRLEYKKHDGDSGDAPEIEKSLLDNILFERDVYMESKRLMGYLFGKKLYNKFIDIMKKSKDPKNPEITKNSFIKNIKNEQDSRYRECMVTLFNEVYLPFLKKHFYLNIDKYNIMEKI